MIGAAGGLTAAIIALGGYVLSGAVGFFFGIVLGIIWKERDMKRKKTERGTVVRTYLVLVGALSILAVAMAFAVVYTSVAAGQAKANNSASQAALNSANEQIAILKKQQTENEVQSDCQQRALEHMIAALLPRSSFAEQEAAVQLVYAKRQEAFLIAVRAGGSGDATLDDLIEAEHVRIKALEELLGSVATTELPSLTEIEACRN